MRAIAAGGPIAPQLLEAARARSGSDPTVAQLLANWNERQINDLDALSQALFDYAIAEKLYRANGRDDDAQFAARRRAQLARMLPDARVLNVAGLVESWSPDASAETSADAQPLPEIPSEPTARHSFDMENANRLAARLPDSPLLETLRTELERARIFDLRASDPKGAAEMLIALGEQQDGAAAGSADLTDEYIELATDIGAASDPASVFGLSVQAVKMIAAALKGPIDADADAADRFRRAADLIAATAATAPRETVAEAMNGLDLGFLDYEYDSLPVVGADAAVRAGESVLEGAVSMAKAVAAVSDEPRRWSALAAQSLFWQGVLVNDRDAAEAARMLHIAADEMRPLAEAVPDDYEMRFRYAEALRWVGLA